MNWMSILGLCMIVIGTVLSFFGTYSSDKEGQAELTKKIQEKNAVIDSINSNNIKLIDQNITLLKSNDLVTNTNNELIGQNKEMIARVGAYQKDLVERDERIKELEELSKKAERGVVSITQFDGTYMVRQGGNLSVTGGTMENKVFKELMKLEGEKKYTEIIQLCDRTIESNPKWYTPYLYKAISLLNLNDKEQGIKLLDYVTNHTLGDPQYILRIANVYSKLGDQAKADELAKTIPKEMIQHLVNESKRNENQKRKN